MSSSSSQPCTQVRTCNYCRQRRVKCDRQLPHCSNCVRLQAQCTYPPGRGRAPKRPKGSIAPQLSERLSRLESILGQFTAAAARENHEPSQPEPDSEEHAFDQDFSRLQVNDSKTRYVQNALWVTLSNEVEELRDLLFEPTPEDDGLHEASVATSITTAATSPSSPRQQGLNAAIFGYRANGSLFHCHPSLPQAVTLFAAFSENVAPMVGIFHMPTMSRIYWDAIASLASLDKHTETLLFAIHYSAVVSLSEEQCLSILNESRETALARFRFAVEQALAQGDLLSTQSMTMLQAAVLFLATLPNGEDSRAAWALTSLVLHIARTMGLHRDGSIFCLKPFETELRRRLWWQICSIDSRSAEYHRMEPITRDFIADTKPPLHIDDADLSPDMTQPPSERWDRATDMTLTSIRCEAMQTGIRLGRVRHRPTRKPDDGNPLQTDEIASLAAKQRRAVIQDLETRYKDKYLPICDSAVPFQLLSSAVARIILGRFWLINQYSAEASKGNGAGAKTTSGVGQQEHQQQHQQQQDRNTCDELLETSIQILELSGALLTDKRLTQFAWYAKTHIQWGAGAMAFVLSELCSRPQSAQCDRAWDCVSILYEGWQVDEISHDESLLALWRPVRRLMAKARYVREMQRTQSGQPHEKQASASSSTGLSSQWSTGRSSSTCNEPAQQTLESTTATEPSFSGFHPAPENRGGQPGALQRVLGTESLDPFMDLTPEWSWVDDDHVAEAWLGGF